MTVRPSTKHDIQRDDENTTRAGYAVVSKILVTGSISMQYTGIDPGTGDVTLLVTGSSASADIQVQDEGSPLGAVQTFNFVGSPVNVLVSGTVARVFITGSSGVRLSDSSPIVLSTAGVTGTYTRPNNLSYIIIEMVGGGGGGGGAIGTLAEVAMAGAGGGGGYLKKRLDPSEFNPTTEYYVGLGGAGGAAGNNAGVAGETSIFYATATLFASGGGGGSGNGSSTTVPRAGVASGEAGLGVGGDINVVGQEGASGSVFSVTSTLPSIGGGNPLSGTVRGETVNEDGINGNPYGGGGSGARTSNNSTDRAGGDGADGVIIIWEYITT